MPAVAGAFYPRDERALAEQVEELVAAGRTRLAGRDAAPEVTAVVAPHAGYLYSGPIAGSAFAALGPRAQACERVVVIGPTHWVAFSGIALSSAPAFVTPLGEVPVARDVVERLCRLPGVTFHDEAHAPEHALEVELPFLQRLLGRFELVPLLTGDVSDELAADVLAASVEGCDALVVVSSDLSHYLDAAAARRADAATARDVEAGRPVRGVQACGATAINALNELAARRGARLEVLDLRSSGDTAGAPDRVVGYGAFRMVPRGKGGVR
ncbi:MAG TPA: AmmeMemoRadiSam system protein B [Thermoanaerobaculia bacterium]|nr:AmmeMemoRadiSam system protein B [Thermoanaerobaculia bacterium]